MAKLWVAAASAGNNGYLSSQPDLYLLDFSSGAEESAVLSPNNALYVRLCADAPCFYETGVSPTVTEASRYLPANTIDYFRAEPGQRIRVAAAAE